MPKVPTGTVVEEFMIGNTKIKICNDAYINRSPKEIEQSLKRINDICLKCVMSDSYKHKNNDDDYSSDHETIPAQEKREQEAHLY